MFYSKTLCLKLQITIVYINAVKLVVEVTHLRHKIKLIPHKNRLKDNLEYFFSIRLIKKPIASLPYRTNDLKTHRIKTQTWLRYGLNIIIDTVQLQYTVFQHINFLNINQLK